MRGPNMGMSRSQIGPDEILLRVRLCSSSAANRLRGKPPRSQCFSTGDSETVSSASNGSSSMYAMRPASDSDWRSRSMPADPSSRNRPRPRPALRPSSMRPRKQSNNSGVSMNLVQHYELVGVSPEKCLRVVQFFPVRAPFEVKIDRGAVLRDFQRHRGLPDLARAKQRHCRLVVQRGFDSGFCQSRYHCCNYVLLFLICNIEDCRKSCKRVDQLNSRGLKVARIPRYDCKPMLKRRGGQEQVGALVAGPAESTSVWTRYIRIPTFRGATCSRSKSHRPGAFPAVVRQSLASQPFELRLAREARSRRHVSGCSRPGRFRRLVRSHLPAARQSVPCCTSSSTRGTI